MADGLTRTRYRIGGMDCAACATKIETAARRTPGIEDVSVSVAAGTLAVRHRPDADLAGLRRKVAGLGYTIADDARDASARTTSRDSHSHEHSKARRYALHGHDHGPADGPWWMTSKGRLTIATGAALLAGWMIIRLVPDLPSWAFAVPMLVGLVPIARRAVMAGLAGSPFSIEMLMTIAAVGAVIIGASEEAAAVVFLFLVGELLERVAAGRARASIQGWPPSCPRPRSSSAMA
jgi:Cd2+/Zn2+-exporting ATPase